MEEISCKWHPSFDISIICLEENCKSESRIGCLKCLRTFHKSHNHMVIQNEEIREENSNETIEKIEECLEQWIIKVRESISKSKHQSFLQKSNKEERKFTYAREQHIKRLALNKDAQDDAQINQQIQEFISQEQCKDCNDNYNQGLTQIFEINNTSIQQSLKADLNRKIEQLQMFINKK